MLAMGRTQWQEAKENLVLWKNWSIDDVSWTPAANFTYQRELKKMVNRDKPGEDIGMGQ